MLARYKVTLTIGSIHRACECVMPPADESVPTILSGQAGGLEMKAIDFEGKVIDTCTLCVGSDSACGVGFGKRTSLLV